MFFYYKHCHLQKCKLLNFIEIFENSQHPFRFSCMKPFMLVSRSSINHKRFSERKQTLPCCNIFLILIWINPLNAELNPICYLLALLGAHHFLHLSRIRVKSLTLRLLMSYIYIYIYGAPILDVSRSHTTTHHSR